MSNTPRNLTRNQLAEFLPNQRAIRAFEQLLKQVSDLLPSDIVTINRMIQETYIEAALGTSRAQEALDLFDSVKNDAPINAGTADAKATAALDALHSIARSLDLLAKAPTDRANNSLSTDYIDFNNNPKFSAKPGRVHWGSTGTLEIEMGGGNITQQVGEEFFVYGKATAAITEGQLIMVTGALGASGVITFAPTATGIIDPNAVLGIATENIPLNGFGRVTTMGVVHGINTTGSSVGEVWADGDVLWYNTAFVGGMTKVKPVAPNMKTQVAIVINAGSGGSGSLQVEVIHGSTLGGTDTNVQFGALASGNMMIYDAVAGYWKNALLTAGTNVTITNGPGSVSIAVAGAAPTGAAGGVLSGIYPNPGFAVDMATQAELDAHTGNTSNPHSTTKLQVGLGNVENTALSTWAGSTNLITLGNGNEAAFSSATAWAANTSAPNSKVTNTSSTDSSTALWQAQVNDGAGTAGGVKFGAVAVPVGVSGGYSADWVIANRNVGTYQENFRVTYKGNIYGNAGSTGMTAGFFYIPSAAGAPTGVPTAYTGRVPMYYDTTNNNFYVYNGAWKKILLV